MLRHCAMTAVVLVPGLIQAAEAPVRAIETTAATAQTGNVRKLLPTKLPLGQTFEIRTEDRVFRGELIDAATGQCLLRAARRGQSFGEPRTVYLLGATHGDQDGVSFMLMHEVNVGMKLELGVDDLDKKNRVLTTRVESISVERSSAASEAGDSDDLDRPRNR